MYWAKEVEGVAYKMTYYADDNGAVGEELSEVPSKAGTYHAKAELVMDDVSAYGEPCKKVTLDGETYSLPLARGWTTYTIQAKDDPRTRSRRIQIQRILTNRILVHRMIRRILEAIILDRI